MSPASKQCKHKTYPLRFPLSLSLSLTHSLVPAQQRHLCQYNDLLALALILAQLGRWHRHRLSPGDPASVPQIHATTPSVEERPTTQSARAKFAFIPHADRALSMHLLRQTQFLSSQTIGSPTQIPVPRLRHTKRFPSSLPIPSFHPPSPANRPRLARPRLHTPKWNKTISTRM